MLKPGQAKNLAPAKPKGKLKKTGAPTSAPTTPPGPPKAQGGPPKPVLKAGMLARLKGAR